MSINFISLFFICASFLSFFLFLFAIRSFPLLLPSVLLLCCFLLCFFVHSHLLFVILTLSPLVLPFTFFICSLCCFLFCLTVHCHWFRFCHHYFRFSFVIFDSFSFLPFFSFSFIILFSRAAFLSCPLSGASFACLDRRGDREM